MKLISVLSILFFLSSCTIQKRDDLGGDRRPIQFFLVPAQDTKSLMETAEKLEKYLKKDLSLNVEVKVPVNYITVVEAFGTQRADIAIINTFGYILAHDKYGAEAELVLINRGRDSYYGQIIAHKDGVKSLEEINGKKFAYVDPASTSGYLMAMDMFQRKNIKPKEFLFSGRHDTVVLAVYNKQVDAGATFYTPPDEDGTPKDARWILRNQLPDVYEKVKILQTTDPIPNDPIAFRKDFPVELKNKIKDSLKKYILTPEGKENLMKMYHITDLKEVNNSHYDSVREILKRVGKNPEDFSK